MRVSRTPVNLAEEAKEAAALFEQQAEEECIDLQVETSEAPVWARADGGGVQIVLRNLVSNALTYTGEGGRMWVRGRNESGVAVLEVEETGTGMAPEEVSRLFEAFK